jgi:hypothetical protein
VAGVQRRQSRPTRRCAGFVVELGKDRQLVIANADDAVGVARGVPFAQFVLVATDDAGTIMGIASIHRSRGKQISELVKTRTVWWRTIDVDAVFRVVIALPQTAANSFTN